MDREWPRRNRDDSWTSDALERGDVAAVMERVRSDPGYLSSRDFVGSTPLLTAIGSNDVHLVEFMLEHGADPNVEVDDGYTCLMTATESEDPASLQILARLINAGADVHCIGIHGWTPLHMAAARGFVEKARLMIEAGADVNRRIQIDGEETPLMEAASQGRAGTVRLLLERGADPTLRDTILGRSPIEMAQKAKNGPDPNVIAHLQDPDTVRLHSEIHSQIIEQVLGDSDLPPEQMEAMRSLLGKSDMVEQYRQAAERTAQDGEFEEVIRLLESGS